MSRSHNKKPPRGARGPGGRLVCYCGCGKEVVPPRRSWFSKECVEKFKMEHDGVFARQRVHQRDRGVCAKCSIDTSKLEAELWQARAKGNGDAAKAALRAKGFDPSGHFWEADHIVEVVRGGAPLGLANLQTLCVPCHKLKTARLAAERAAERHAAKVASEQAIQPNLF